MTEIKHGELRTRRSLLAAAGGAAAAAAVAAISPKAARAASTAMMTEVTNTAAGVTTLSNTTADSDALAVYATGAGTAVNGITDKGMGLFGASADTSDPETNTRNAGVVGFAGSTASMPDNIGLSGVFGYGDPSPVDGYVGTGVWGDSPDVGVVGTGSIGVEGIGGWGVYGYSDSTDGIGVLATGDDPTAVALRVEGRAAFTRSGRTTIASGKSSKAVTLAGCTSSTLVLAVLASNRSGRYVRAVVPAAGKFTIYLNSTVSSTTNVTWIAFTNPSNHSG